MLPGSRKAIRTSLLVLAASLVLVGIVSGTLVRHLIQIIPIVIALLVYQKGAKWAPIAAMPIFMFWLLVVILIWMFLLGMSRIANGHYTTIEVVSTVVMALCSLVGIPASWQAARHMKVLTRIVVWLLFLGIQLTTMWVSFLEPFVNR